MLTGLSIIGLICLAVVTLVISFLGMALHGILRASAGADVLFTHIVTAIIVVLLGVFAGVSGGAAPALVVAFGGMLGLLFSSKLRH